MIFFIFFLNLILNFDFSKSHPGLVKSKNENHQNSMCDSSKEPYWLSDSKSEENRKKNIEIWLNE